MYVVVIDHIIGKIFKKLDTLIYFGIKYGVTYVF